MPLFPKGYLTYKARRWVIDLPSYRKAVFLAGSFGQKLQVSNLQRLGLLAKIDPAKIHGIGNSALAGAQLMLLSKAHRERMEELRGQIEYVELSAYDGFADAYADALPFPTGEEHPQQEG